MQMRKMQRVFTNIVKNSFEAMLDGGKLEITTKQNAEYCSVCFSDTGSGMTQDTIEKIFTPLFTTKSQGMGFGLPICKRIIEAHGGTISVQSTIGKGTTFTLTLHLDTRMQIKNHLL
jgi:signal transduction histidine kinase